VAGIDSQTLPMVIYAMARRGVSPMLNAVSTLIVMGLGVLVIVSERLRSS
jgi:spermidine/putrescine transport system permease protein